MTDPTPPEKLPFWPPRRSLEHASVTIEDGQPVVTFLCDCATETAVVLVDAHLSPGEELAYTCDGCGTVHWFWYEIKAPGPS